MASETVIDGVVLRAGEPVAAAYVRLLGATGEFVAEVVSSPAGEFRFFAAPGHWTLRALAPGARGVEEIVAERGVNPVQVSLEQVTG